MGRLGLLSLSAHFNRALNWLRGEIAGGPDAMPKTQAAAILISIIAGSVSIADTVTHAELSDKVISTVREVRAALRACWVPPSSGIAHANTMISVRLSLKRHGEILGNPDHLYKPGHIRG
jgi:hypothetical protein